MKTIKVKCGVHGCDRLVFPTQRCAKCDRVVCVKHAKVGLPYYCSSCYARLPEK